VKKRVKALMATQDATSSTRTLQRFCPCHLQSGRPWELCWRVASGSWLLRPAPSPARLLAAGPEAHPPHRTAAESLHFTVVSGCRAAATLKPPSCQEHSPQTITVLWLRQKLACLHGAAPGGGKH
jgi:hypothetical protein